MSSLSRMEMRKIKWLLTALIFVILVFSIFISATSGSSNNGSGGVNWPIFRQNQNHLGAANAYGSTNSAKVLWTYTTGRMVQSSPAVVDGHVFIGSRDSQLFCLTASDGEVIWKYAFNSEVWTSPAVWNGFVYVGIDDGLVYCLNATQGTFIWKTPIGISLRSSPTIVDGVVYIGSGKQNLYALNATNGTVLWVFPTSSPVNSSPAYSNGTVYFADSSDSVYAVNASTGTELWVHQIKTSISSPAVDNGYLYIGSYNGFVYGLNASTGAEIWKFRTADEVDSSPAVVDGRIYIGSDDNNVYCLNASNGNKIWQASTGFWVTSSPAISGYNVYVGSRDNNIYCFNASTGAKMWEYETKNYVESSPAIVNNVLYVGSDDNTVYALTLFNSTSQINISYSTDSVPWTTIAFDAVTCIISAIIVFSSVRFVYFTKRNKQNAASMDIASQKISWFRSHADLIFVLGILAFAIPLFFVNLGNGVLQVADEQTYSQWAYHMVKSGDYLTPWASGTELFLIGKPPFLMWLMSLAYQVFGVNNFASRIWSAVFGTLSLMVMFYLGKKLYNSYVGFLSALVLGTFITYFVFARYAMTDVPFVFFFVASVYFFVLSEKTGNDWKYAILSGLCFGLALMTKQTAALLIPLIIFSYLISTRRSLRFLFSKQFVLFLGLGLLVFAPWLIYMSIQFGSPFWQGYFGYGVFSRSVSPLEGHTESYLFYFSYLANRENLLWVALLPFSAGLVAYNSIVKHLKEDMLILLWMALVLVVFTLAQTKIYWYIMPVFPAFAIAISSFLYQLSKKINRQLKKP
jgi:outer membrane protein assembly factor BamB